MRPSIRSAIALCTLSSTALLAQSHVTVGMTFSDAAVPGLTITVKCTEQGKESDDSGHQRDAALWEINSQCGSGGGSFLYEIGERNGTNRLPSHWERFGLGSGSCPTGTGQTPSGFAQTRLWGSCSEKQFILIQGIPAVSSRPSPR
jgi:hypothetical protein